MGATTKQGRTRNRRAQALNSIINGQQPVLYFHECQLGLANLISVGMYDSTLQPFETPITQPGSKLKIGVWDGTDLIVQEVSFTTLGNVLSFTPSPPAVLSNNIVILPWNEGLRGSYGEWFMGAVLDVTA